MDPLDGIQGDVRFSLHNEPMGVVVESGIRPVEVDGVRAILLPRDLRDDGDRDLIEYRNGDKSMLACRLSLSEGMTVDDYVADKLGISPDHARRLCKAAFDEWCS